MCFGDFIGKRTLCDDAYHKEHASHTPNANMVDHSVVARDELHESEVSQSSMFCFENASPENSCFIVDLFHFI